MAYGYKPQRPGVLDPNAPRKKQLPVSPEEDLYPGMVPDFVDLPEPVSPLPLPPLTPGMAPPPRQMSPAPRLDAWQTPPRDLTNLRAWYTGAAEVPGAPPTPEWGKRTPSYSRLNPPPSATRPAQTVQAPPPALPPGTQRAVSGIPVGPKGFTPTMPLPSQGMRMRPSGLPVQPQPTIPAADRQRFTLAEAERRAMQQTLAGQGAGQYLQEAGMPSFTSQPRGIADIAKEAFIRQAGGAAGLATGGTQRTSGEMLRDQYLALRAGIPQAGATALNFMDVLGRSATAGAPVGQPGASYSPSPATVTPSPVFGYTARGLQQTSQDILGQRSPAIQRREQQAEAELAQSQDNALEQVARFALQVYKDPALAEKHVLTNLPMMVPGLAAGKVMQTAARVSQLATAEQAAGLGAATAGVLSGAMTASDAQTTAYDNIKQALMARGIPEKDADQEAFRKSLLSFGIGAALGVAGGMTGAEASAFGGAAQGLRGRLQRAAMEPVTELGEELTPLITSNIQAGLPAMQNVGQTAGATLLATAPFAGLAAIGRSDGGTRKVPDALQTEAAPAVPPPTGQFGGVIPPSAARQRYESWTQAGGPRVPEDYRVLRKSRSLPGQVGLPPVGLPPAGLPPAPLGRPAGGTVTGAQPARPAPPVAPETATTGVQQAAPDISFRPLTTVGAPGARPVLPFDRVPEQIALRTMRGTELMGEVEPELEARRARGEELTARDVKRPKTEPAYIAQAINKTSTRVLGKVAPAYGIDTTNIDEAAGDVLTNIAREMSEMDNREYTVADIRGAVRLQTSKAAKLAGNELSTLWSRWNEQYGKKMGLSDREYTDLQNLAAGNYGFTFRPDVQAILLGDVGAPYANKQVMEVIRQDMARLMGLPPQDYPSISLTTVPPHAWRNWALVRQLDVIAPEAYRELMEAVERGPRLQTLTSKKKRPGEPTPSAPPPPSPQGPPPLPATPAPPSATATTGPTTRPVAPTPSVKETVSPPRPTTPPPTGEAPAKPKPVRPKPSGTPAVTPTAPPAVKSRITQKDAEAAGWSQQAGGTWSGPDNTSIERFDRAKQPWVYTDASGNRTGYDTLSDALREAIQKASSEQVTPPAPPSPARTQPKSTAKPKPRSATEETAVPPPPKAQPRKKRKSPEPPVTAETGVPGGPVPLLTEAATAFNESASETRQRIANVRYGPIKRDGEETVLFTLDNQQYEGYLRGRNRDLVLGLNEDADKRVAVRVLLDGHAAPVAKVEPTPPSATDVPITTPSAAAPSASVTKKAPTSDESKVARIKAVLAVLRSPTHKFKDFRTISAFRDREAERVRQKAIQALTGRPISATWATFRRLLDELAVVFNMQPASKSYRRALVHIDNALSRFESGETEIAPEFVPRKAVPVGYVPPELPESERVGASALNDDDLLELIVYGMRQIEPNLSFDTFVPLGELREFFKKEFPTLASFDVAIQRLSATKPLAFSSYDFTRNRFAPSPSVSVIDPVSKGYWTGVTFDEDFAPDALTRYKGKSPEELLGKQSKTEQPSQTKPSPPTPSTPAGAAATTTTPTKVSKPKGKAQAEAIPDDVRQALATLDSPKGKTSRVRKIVKATFPEIGPKAIFINDNIEQIIAEAEANGKVTKECP